MMHRDRAKGPRRFRRELRFELLEVRRYLAADAGNVSQFEGRDIVANELLVQYSPQALLGQRNAALVEAGASVAETIHTKVMQQSGLGVLERIALAPGTDLAKAMQSLKRDPNVLYVEPNYIYRPAVVSNDTYYNNGSLWGMYSDDSPSAVGPANTTNQFGSQAEKAWNDNITGSASIVVGVIDQGIQVTHPDLVDNIWVNPYEVANDGIDNDGNGFIDDVNGWDFVNNDKTVYDAGGDAHGTHVAGTIGGKGGNGAGVVGVNWQVTMISTKFLGTNGGSTANAVKALDYLTDLKTRHGINIVATNNSWGGGGYSQSLHDAIIRSAKKDILFVAAAGNSTSNNDTTASYPSNYNTTVGTSTQTAASYDSVIAVASITSTGAISGFSSYGATTVDIGAPGSGIWSTVPSNTYASYNGTSMATPHVTGAVALYASTKPVGTSAASIRQMILQTATPTPSLAGKTVTGGRLNAYEAVRPRALVNVSAPSPSSSTTEAGGTVSFTIVLGAPPTANVTIPVASNDLTEGTVSTSSVVFTSANWNVAQTVTVKGVDDSVDDGNVAYKVTLGAVVSADVSYNGLKPSDVSLINLDDDTAGITVSNPTGTTTTEAGASVSFTVRLDSEPTADVTIPVSSSDTTEGVVSTSSLVFTPSNWNVAQTVIVRGVDDTIFDGNVPYTVILGAAVSTDSLYNGKNPPDISLTNLDDEPPPSTKFYVANDAATNRTYEYDAAGAPVENYLLSSLNTTPKGIATNVAGDRIWVVDNNRTVYVYNNSGTLLGSWVAGALPSNAIVEGITTDGTSIWIVESRGDRVYYYANAASRIAGSQSPISGFSLNSANAVPRDLVTDGASIWVVNDSTTDRVFRYSMTGTLLNSWAINSANASPTGITLDPSNGSQDLWIVDRGTDSVYRYANARTLAAPALTSIFALAAGNTDPQGIADPPAGEAFGTWEVFVAGADALSIDHAMAATSAVSSMNSPRIGSAMETSGDASRWAVRDSGNRDLLGRRSVARTVDRLITEFELPSDSRLVAASVSANGPAAGDLGRIQTKDAKLQRIGRRIHDQVFADLGSDHA